MNKQNSFGFDVPVQLYSDDPPVIYDVAIKAAYDGIRDASREAYDGMKKKGKLGKQEVVIREALIDQTPMTLQEIKLATGIDINAVSGRVNDLKKKNILVEVQKRVCKVTGRMVTPVKVNR